MRFVPVTFLAVVACGGAGDPDDPDPDGGSTSSDPAAPRILALDANVGELHEVDSLVVTAVVTDPDGIDDLIGGTLLDPESGATYGAFATSAAEGAYSITLTWGEVDQVRGIDAPSSGVSRSFRARFFDVAGHTVEDDVDVVLRCENTDLSACGGDCVDLLTSPHHCGACHMPVPEQSWCEGGVPSCPSTAENTPSACTDGCSNDGDSYIDCDDFNCCDVVSCPPDSACGS
jgi:hypothetical protein